MSKNKPALIPELEPDWDDMQSCCNALQSRLGSKVSLPDSPTYNKFLQGYWSERESELSTACIVSPTCAEDVGTAISTLASYPQCHFAVRGGGHTGWSGAANVDRGVTFDMTLLNEVSVSDDYTVTTVGAGARWEDVYKYLDPLNLMVVGGRFPTVGVSGLTLGGGLSSFSPRDGLVCDNVLAFQLVMADGTLEWISESKKPDLFRALKGGSNNFGIVTAFKLKTFLCGPMWSGLIVNPLSASGTIIDAFRKLVEAPEQDLYAAVVPNFSWSSDALGLGSAASTAYLYTKIPAKDEVPPVLADIVGVQPQLLSSLRVQPYSEILSEFANFTIPNAPRRSIATISFRLDGSDYMHKLFNIVETHANALIKEVTYISFTLTLQYIPKLAAQGNNVLGLNKEHGTIMNACFLTQWAGNDNDDIVQGEIKNIVEESTKLAEEMGLGVKFLYLNYAEKWQDPISGYGKEEVEFLRNVSRKYDPKGVFQTQMRGGFRLWETGGSG